MKEDIYAKPSVTEQWIENTGATMKDKVYWFWLSKKERIGNATIRRLLESAGSVKGIYDLTENEINQLEFVKKDAKEELLIKEQEEKLHQELLLLKNDGISFITIEDEEYPEKLYEIYDRPFYLYVKGRLPDAGKPCLAVIGARECSIYGREIAKKFSRDLSDCGVQIISGLAKGIDGYAHRGALEGLSPTFGVIGNGIGSIYPKENALLFEQVERKGGILSEYPVGAKALPFHFPMRNRIISGLSDGIFVIEARKRSGTLITVDSGLEQGRDIFALPGRICDDLSMGCNELIKLGAKPVTCVDDIMEEYVEKYPILNSRNTNQEGSQKGCLNDYVKLTGKEDMVYRSLSVQPKQIGEIMEESQICYEELIQIMVELVRKGKAVPSIGMSYRRKEL